MQVQKGELGITGDKGAPGVDASGEVVGPASSIDNAIARHEWTTGKLIQNSIITVSDTENFSLSDNKLLKSDTTNLSLGRWSLDSNVSGSSGTAFGNHSLQFSTSPNNTALGYASCGVTATGRDLTACGERSLGSNTTGSNHAAFGNATLQLNTTGSNCSAFGYYALQNCTVSDNTAVGYEARVTTTGSGIVAVGSLSLRNNTTGSGNVALGNECLYRVTTATSNTAAGFFSIRKSKLFLR